MSQIGKKDKEKFQEIVPNNMHLMQLNYIKCPRILPQVRVVSRTNQVPVLLNILRLHRKK